MNIGIDEVLKANTNDTVAAAAKTAGVHNITLPDGRSPSDDHLKSIGISLLGAVREGMNANLQLGA